MNPDVTTMKNLIALFLLLATAFGVLALGIGSFGSKSVEEQKDPINQLLENFGKETTAPEQTTSSQVTTQKPIVIVPPTVPDKQYADNLSAVFVASAIEGLVEDRLLVSIEKRVELYEKLSGVYTKDAANEGAEVVSVDDYNAQSDYIVASKWENSNDFTCGTHNVEILSYIQNEYDGGYSAVKTVVTREKIAVTAYMGYILYTYMNEEGAIKTAVCLPDGKMVIENIGDKIPAYCRDFSNDPVFTNGAGTKYYALRQKTAKDGTISYAFESVKQEKVRVGLYYDYPATPVGLYQNKYELSYRTDREFYLFYNPFTDKRVISSHIAYGFNFTAEGVAVVQRSDENEVWIINTNGRAVLRADNTWINVGGADGKQYAIERFVLPKTFGIESMGCQGFDQGWVRMLVQMITPVSEVVMSEKFELIDINGNKFDIPDGFSLEGYSDGVLLLKKDSLFGYYSIDGYWIAQPIYTYARPFVQGLAVVGYEHGTLGMIDTRGNIVLPFVFTYLGDVSSGRIVGYCEGVGFSVFTIYRDPKGEK